MKMRCFACVSHSVADDQGQLTESEMNRLCYFGASIVPVERYNLRQSTYKKVQVSKSLFKKYKLCI